MPKTSSGLQVTSPAGFRVSEVLTGATQAGATIFEARAISDIARGDRILKIKWFIIGMLTGVGLRRQLMKLFKG